MRSRDEGKNALPKDSHYNGKDRHWPWGGGLAVTLRIHPEAPERPILPYSCDHEEEAPEPPLLPYSHVLGLLTVNGRLSHALDALVQLADLLQTVLEHRIGLVGGRVRRDADGGQRPRPGQHLRRDVVVGDDVLVTICLSAALAAFVWSECMSCYCRRYCSSKREVHAEILQTPVRAETRAILNRITSVSIKLIITHQLCNSMPTSRRSRKTLLTYLVDLRFF